MDLYELKLELIWVLSYLPSICLYIYNNNFLIARLVLSIWDLRGRWCVILPSKDTARKFALGPLHKVQNFSGGNVKKA